MPFFNVKGVNQGPPITGHSKLVKGLFSESQEIISRGEESHGGCNRQSAQYESGQSQGSPLRGLVTQIVKIKGSLQQHPTPVKTRSWARVWSDQGVFMIQGMMMEPGSDKGVQGFQGVQGVQGLQGRTDGWCKS
jgi:hypothetical protein